MSRLTMIWEQNIKWRLRRYMITTTPATGIIQKQVISAEYLWDIKVEYMIMLRLMGWDTINILTVWDNQLIAGSRDKAEYACVCSSSSTRSCSCTSTIPFPSEHIVDVVWISPNQVLALTTNNVFSKLLPSQPDNYTVIRSRGSLNTLSVTKVW